MLAAIGKPIGAAVAARAREVVALPGSAEATRPDVRVGFSILPLAGMGNWLHDWVMLTERPPRNAGLRTGFQQSDVLTSLPVPPDNRLFEQAKLVASALVGGTAAGLQPPCSSFLSVAADFYGVEKPGIHVLAARPIRVREGGWGSELFGDYSPTTFQIRIWMRTAIRKQVTSFGTFLSTLCHEFCHHLDYQRFIFKESWHTRGFYERTAVLYHHARGTPAKRLVWVKMSGGRWRIDWLRTQRGS